MRTTVHSRNLIHKKLAVGSSSVKQSYKTFSVSDLFDSYRVPHLFASYQAPLSCFSKYGGNAAIYKTQVDIHIDTVGDFLCVMFT